MIGCMAPKLKSRLLVLVPLLVLVALVQVLLRNRYGAGLVAAVSVALLLQVYVFGKKPDA